MRFALCEAVARCHTRRLRMTFATAPLPATTVVVLVALAPIALARVGQALGSELVGVVSAAGVADALVVGPVLAAAVAGAALVASLPGRSAVGEQIGAGPCRGIAVTVAGLLVPALIGLLAVLPSLVAVCVGLAGDLPGGRTAGLALATATLAAIPAGAVLAEGLLAAARGVRRRSLAIAGGALAWAVTGAALGSSSGATVLGPLAPAGAALRGSASPRVALAAACAVLVVLGLGWLPLAAARPERRSRAGGSTRRIVRERRLFPVPAAMVALLSRRDDVRLASAGALVFGAAGIVLAAATGAPAPAPFLLATTTALLGSILCSLAICGVLLGGRWLWFGGPSDRRLIGLAACLVGLTGSTAPVAAVGVGALAATGGSWGAVGVVAGIVIVSSATALVAGALVPWASAGVGDQLTTFAALAALAIVASVTVGVVAPRLVARGLPDAVVGVAVCGASIGAALHAVGRRLRIAA
jgi:hypothetical protein